MSKTGMRFLWPPPSAPNSNRLFSNLASRLYVLPSDAHVLAHLADRLKLAWPIDAADLNQHRWLKVEPALVVVLDTVAVFPRRELRSQPFARIQAIALLRDLDLVGARRISDFQDFRSQQKRLDATLGTVKTVGPALGKFYNSLSDEQKARFNSLRSASRPTG